MEVKVIITQQELEAIKAYADFMRDNEWVIASGALTAANKRAINAENTYQNALDAFTID